MAPRILSTAALPFPAIVTSPAGDHWPMARCRVQDEDGAQVLEVFVYEQGRVRLAAAGKVTAYDPPERASAGTRQTWLLTTPDGPFLVAAGQGCGCGHPLKRASIGALDQAYAAGVRTP